MGKSKRLKTQHLTEAEIWDDSALIRSWDEAVAEYEYYHSIHARGEDVEAILKQAALDEIAENNASASTNGKNVAISNASDAEADFEDGEVEDEDGDEDSSKSPTGGGGVGRKGPYDHEPELFTATDVGNTQQHSNESSAPILGPDQVLENVKMAYWWAGYYSGLYEAQQQQQRERKSEA